MPPSQTQLFSLPFITREMLQLPSGSQLALRVTEVSDQAQPVKLRGLTRSGYFGFTFTTVGDTNPNTQDFPISDVPIMLSLVDPAGNWVQGEGYFTISLVIDGDVYMDLCAGTVSYYHGISYPSTTTPLSAPDRGDFYTLQGSDPAAGAEQSYQLPTGYTIRIHAISVRLVTDSNVANRTVQLKIGDTTPPFYSGISSVTQPASTTYDYYFGAFPGAQVATIGTSVLVPMGMPLLLDTGRFIKTVTNNKQAGDNYGPLNILLEKWPLY